jgi:uncharacterized membrane protein
MSDGVESDERMLHRLEAFSDVVLGFSLALLGLNLVIPRHATDVYRDPIGLMAFFFTFGMVAAVWYSHHRLFSKFFVPNRAMILLNFAMLAFTVLLVYMLEVFMHFSDGGSVPDYAVAGASYCGAFAIVYALLAVLFVLGVRTLWDALSPADRIVGIQSAVRVATVAVSAVAGCTIAWLAHVPIGAGFTFIVVGMAGARVANARIAAKLSS